MFSVNVFFLDKIVLVIIGLQTEKGKKEIYIFYHLVFWYKITILICVFVLKIYNGYFVVQKQVLINGMEDFRCRKQLELKNIWKFLFARVSISNIYLVHY